MSLNPKQIQVPRKVAIMSDINKNHTLDHQISE